MDVNGDGRSDLVQIKNNDNRAQVLLSKGDGSFSLAYQKINYPNDGKIWRAGSDTVSTFVMDVNGDGRSDLVQIMNKDYRAQVLLSKGDGRLSIAYLKDNYPHEGKIWRAGCE